MESSGGIWKSYGGESMTIPVEDTGIPRGPNDGESPSPSPEKTSDWRAKGQVRRKSSWDDVGRHCLMSEPKGPSSSIASI